MNPQKGTVFTEAGARWYARKPKSSGTPTEVIRWLRSRQAAGKTVPGVYLCWELMVGNSNCRWYWGSRDGTPEPAIPWCGLLWPNGAPVSYAEAEAIRSYTTGEHRAFLFEDFQSLPFPEQPAPSGWTSFPNPGATTGSRYFTMEGTRKVVAGETSWTNYLVEAVVMLKEARGNAGLVFRVNEPGPGPDQMQGYYVGFSTNTLELGRMNNGYKSLTTIDLRQRLVDLDTWHLLRISAEGNRFRVWFDPVHDDTRPVLDMRDEQSTILSGGVGLRVHRTSAWFDDIVVLPLRVLDASDRE
jgi:hypothetical protein